MEHFLYKLDKTDITFENYCLIDVKLFGSNFNYPKFYAITYFDKCILDYKSIINYDMTNSKVVHKYLFKAFYRRINKKKYDLQILIHNIRHINIISMQDIILIAKVLDKNDKKKQLFVNMPNVKIMQIYNTTNFLLKYN